MPKVTVAIPTYNREEYLKESLKSILDQSFQDFSVIVFDNHSDYDIRRLIADFNDHRISLIQSDVNIGNAANFHKIFNYKYDSEYLIIFHDDDAMHPELLEAEVSIMDKDKNIMLVGAEMNFISDDKQMFVFKPFKKEKSAIVFSNCSGLIRMILKDFNLCFDSAMYRTAALIDIADCQKRFSKWADRPIMVEIAKKGNSALIREKLVNYRIHSNQDSQSGFSSESKCLLNLYKYYRDNLPQPLRGADQRLFNRFSTNQIVLSGLGFSRNFKEYINFIEASKKEGLFSFRYLNIRGLYYFLRVLRRFL